MRIGASIPFPHLCVDCRVPSPHAASLLSPHLAIDLNSFNMWAALERSNGIFIEADTAKRPSVLATEKPLWK